MSVVAPRRLLALLLALAPLVPAAQALAGPPADPHACTDHACFCAARAARPASRACHESPQAREEAMKGACRHGASAPQFTLGLPYLLPEPVFVRVPDPDGERVALAAPAAAPGFRELDTPPPRLG
jgi:hypothetical protein